MSILLITYDLNKPGQNYSGFYDVLKKFKYARLSESSYAIETNESPKSIYDQLLPYIDQNDYIYVITLNSPFYGHGPKEVNNWLSQRL